MTKQDKAFELFEQGIVDPKEVAEKVDCPVSSVYKYKSLWKQSKLANMSMDEFTDKLFDSDTDNGKQCEPQADNDVTEEELHNKEPKVITDVNKAHIEHIADTGKMIDETRKPTIINETFEEAVSDMFQTTKKISKLKEISKVVTYAGEFGNYATENKVIEVRLETAEMTLDKELLLAFIEELQDLSGRIE